jgi:hypothetical protein
MGGPVGSVNREKPFNDALRIAPRARPQSPRRIADRLIDKAEQGDLPSIRELVDRLDGRPVQIIDRHELLVTELTDAELLVSAVRGRCEGEIKVIPPMPLND